jgi:hypothetical protein
MAVFAALGSLLSIPLHFPGQWWLWAFLGADFGALLYVLANFGAYAYWMRNGWVVAYFDDSSYLVLHLTKTGSWLITDNVAYYQGQGAGADFRKKVFKHLAKQADKRRSAIEVAAHPNVAALYQAEMPGLEEVSRRDTGLWRFQPTVLLRRIPT